MNINLKMLAETQAGVETGIHLDWAVLITAIGAIITAIVTWKVGQINVDNNKWKSRQEALIRQTEINKQLSEERKKWIAKVTDLIINIHRTSLDVKSSFFLTDKPFEEAGEEIKELLALRTYACLLLTEEEMDNRNETEDTEEKNRIIEKKNEAINKTIVNINTLVNIFAADQRFGKEELEKKYAETINNIINNSITVLKEEWIQAKGELKIGALADDTA